MNIINWIKNKFNSKGNTNVPIRTPDELFQSGNILNAKDSELKSVIVEIANQTDQSQIIQSRNTIRSLVVNNIQNQRHADKIDQHNSVLTIIIIILTVINIYLAIQQTNYSEVQSRAERIHQEQSIQNAINLCNQSPDLQQSGLYDVSNGNSASCSEVLKQYK